MINLKVLLPYILTASICSAQNLRQRKTQAVDLLSAFNEIRPGFVWPTPESDETNISSTFGPRTKISTGKYDFHRGVDISGNVGEPVVATYGGVVKQMGTFYDGGNYITLEHTFPTKVLFHDKEISKWYTLYLHLNTQNVTLGQVVTAGQFIGQLGNTGAATVTPHLHHEVRVGTRCTLEYHLENPSSTCNLLGFDPQVHALYLHPHADTTSVLPSISVTQSMSSTTDGVFTFETPNTNPNVNRYHVKVVDHRTGAIKKEHILDLNLRIGFNPTSTEALDVPDTNFPYLSPLPFGNSATTWSSNLVIPTVWIPSFLRREKIVVTVTTIWGGSETIEWGRYISW